MSYKSLITMISEKMIVYKPLIITAMMGSGSLGLSYVSAAIPILQFILLSGSIFMLIFQYRKLKREEKKNKSNG